MSRIDRCSENQRNRSALETVIVKKRCDFLLRREIASLSVSDGSYPVIRKNPKKVNDFHPFKAIIEKQV